MPRTTGTRVLIHLDGDQLTGTIVAAVPRLYPTHEQLYDVDLDGYDDETNPVRLPAHNIIADLTPR